MMQINQVPVARLCIRRSTIAVAASFLILSSFAVAETPAESHDDNVVCQNLPSHLLPMRIQKARWPQGQLSEHPSEWSGYEMVYTAFNLPGFSETLVLSSGYLLPPGGKGRLTPLSLNFSTAGYFGSELWVNNRPSDVMEYGLQPAVILVRSVISFMEFGLKVDDDFKRVRAEGADFGVYDCQSCSGQVPAFAKNLAQDTSTMRVAELFGRTYMISTKPKTIVAELSPPSTVARYFACPSQIGKVISADSARARQRAHKAEFDQMEF